MYHLRQPDFGEGHIKSPDELQPGMLVEAVHVGYDIAAPLGVLAVGKRYVGDFYSKSDFQEYGAKPLPIVSDERSMIAMTQQPDGLLVPATVKLVDVGLLPVFSGHWTADWYVRHPGATTE